jgi:thiosulfate dehydrogenase [quinone] large subunit
MDATERAPLETAPMDTAHSRTLGQKIGIGLVVFLRLFNGVFYFAAGVNKLRKGWLWSDKLETVLTERLTQIEPESFGALFLTKFALPLYVPTAYVVTICELIAGACLLLGYRSRWAAGLALWLNLMIGIGGYYDASLIALDILILPLVLTPSGHWLGLDAKMSRRFPRSRWYR